MKKILIISDTHGSIEPIKLVIKKEKPNYVIHAGDFCVDIDFMKEHFTHFVAGNNDLEGSNVLEFTIENIKFVLTHGHKIITFFSFHNTKMEKLCEYLTSKNADVLIFGHTHIEMFEKNENLYMLNPGSLVYPRNASSKKTYMILHVEDGKITETNLNDAIRYFSS